MRNDWEETKEIRSWSCCNNGSAPLCQARKVKPRRTATTLPTCLAAVRLSHWEMICEYCATNWCSCVTGFLGKRQLFRQYGKWWAGRVNHALDAIAKSGVEVCHEMWLGLVVSSGAWSDDVVQTCERRWVRCGWLSGMRHRQTCHEVAVKKDVSVPLVRASKLATVKLELPWAEIY